MKVIEMIALTERDVMAANRELSDLRNECSHVDATNMNLKKDIDLNESMLAQAKDISFNQYDELSRVREVSFNLDKDIDAQQKRIDILRSEAENNEHRIASINDMLAQRDDAISRTVIKISEA